MGQVVCAGRQKKVVAEGSRRQVALDRNETERDGARRGEQVDVDD